MDCVNCGNETGSKSKYCSVSCKSQYWREKRKFSQSSNSITDPLPKKDPELVNSDPKPIETFTRFDGQIVPLTEFELARELFDKLFGRKATQKVSQSSDETRQPTATELAKMREEELNRGKYSSTVNYETVSQSFEPAQSQETQVQSQPRVTKPVTRAPTWINKLRDRFAPKQEEPEFPPRPLNEYGMPLSNYKCLTERKWVGHSERALCDYRGHSLEYVP